jgi:hypothetical protein
MTMVGVDLLPGERIRWEGRPVRAQLFRPPDAILIPFSIVWSGFAVGVAAGSVFGGDPGSIFLVPFAAVGLYLLFGRFIVRAIAARHTRYLVTDRRVLVIGGLSGNKTTSSYLYALPPPILKERPDRSGSLAFGAFPRIGDTYGRSSRGHAWAAEPSSTPVLWNIPEVRFVRDVVANAQREHGRST